MIGEGKNIEFAPPTAGFQHGESATSILIIWSEIAAAPCFLAKAKRGPRNDFLIDSSAALGPTSECDKRQRAN